MSTYFVILIERGADYRWPPEGKPLIRTKAEDTPVFAWVRADSHENAARQVFDSLDVDLKGRLDPVATVYEVPDERVAVEVKLL